MKSLYEALRNCTYILSNDLEKGIECNEPLIEVLTNANRKDVYESKLKDLNQDFGLDLEFEGIDTTLFTKDAIELLSDSQIEILENCIADMEYDTIYQTYHIDEPTFILLKDYGQIVWYNEELNAYFWGINHYGTAWSHVLNNVYPIKNGELYS